MPRSVPRSPPAPAGRVGTSEIEYGHLPTQEKDAAAGPPRPRPTAVSPSRELLARPPTRAKHEIDYFTAERACKAGPAPGGSYLSAWLEGTMRQGPLPKTEAAAIERAEEEAQPAPGFSYLSAWLNRTANSRPLPHPSRPPAQAKQETVKRARKVGSVPPGFAAWMKAKTWLMGVYWRGESRPMHEELHRLLDYDPLKNNYQQRQDLEKDLQFPDLPMKKKPQPPRAPAPVRERLRASRSLSRPPHPGTATPDKQHQAPQQNAGTPCPPGDPVDTPAPPATPAQEPPAADAPGPGRASPAIEPGTSPDIQPQPTAGPAKGPNGAAAHLAIPRPGAMTPAAPVAAFLQRQHRLSGREGRGENYFLNYPPPATASKKPPHPILRRLSTAPLHARPPDTRRSPRQPHRSRHVGTSRLETRLPPTTYAAPNGYQNQPSPPPDGASNPGRRTRRSVVPQRPQRAHWKPGRRWSRSVRPPPPRAAQPPRARAAHQHPD